MELKSLREITNEHSAYVLDKINFGIPLGGRFERECAIAFFEQAVDAWHGETWKIPVDVTLDLFEWAKSEGYDITLPTSNRSPTK